MGRLVTRYVSSIVPSFVTSCRPLDGYMHLRRIRLNSGGYDEGGAYWGLGSPLYQYSHHLGDIEGYIRADDRDDAKAIVLARYPNAKFFK